MKNILKNTKKVSIFILLLFIFTLTINTQVTHADVINNTDFVTTWKTDNTGTSNSTSITIPMVGGPYDVDWNNDGVYDQTGLSGPVTHDFGVAGTYTVRIKDAKQIRFANGGDRRKILSVDQWGTSVWTSMDQAFHGCSNVLVLAIDAPDTSLVTSLLSTFYNATSLSGTGNWNWNTSNVTSMRYTFWGDVNFNGDISSWDTSHVTNMQEMMPYTSSFNRNIGLWDVSSVTRMDYLLYGATNFNQDLSQWDVSNLQNATSIFALASDFDQDLSSWNINNVTSFDSIFDQTSLSTKNYDSILISWSSQNPKSGVLFRDTPTQYCKGQTARQSLIDNYGWTITDGGYGNCSVYIPGTPSSPDLNIVSDSGVSNTDNITNDNTPVIDLVCTEIGSTLNVLVNGSPSINHTCTSVGTYQATLPQLADGSYSISYTESNIYGESPSSPLLSLITDTNITQSTINYPAQNDISGRGESNSTVVINTTSGATCTTNVLVDGTWSCTLSTDSVPGEQATISTTDIAGNTSSFNFSIYLQPSSGGSYSPSSFIFGVTSPTSTTNTITTPTTPTTPTTTPLNTFISPLDNKTQLTCNPFRNYLKLNSKTNNIDEVKLWQAFLNKYNNESLPITGYYGPLTSNAIKRFQLKYKDEILTPWNLTNPTGYTYKTTRAKGNSLLGCSEGELLLDNGNKVDIK